MYIVFKDYNEKDKLDMFNKKLARVSKGRFELRKSKRGSYYLYDYDFRELTRSRRELKDIIECMNLYNEFKELSWI